MPTRRDASRAGVEGGAEALDDGDRAAAAIRHTVVAGAAAQEAEHGAQVHRHDCAAQVMIPGQQIPNAVR